MFLASSPHQEFESYVISYRTKTFSGLIVDIALFESYVISYRTKTTSVVIPDSVTFESYVISYNF